MRKYLWFMVVVVVVVVGFLCFIAGSQIYPKKTDPKFVFRLGELPADKLLDELVFKGESLLNKQVIIVGKVKKNHPDDEIVMIIDCTQYANTNEIDVEILAKYDAEKVYLHNMGVWKRYKIGQKKFYQRAGRILGLVK